MTTKDIHFRIPEAMWKLWIRAMPAKGERTQYLRKCVGVAIRQMQRREEENKRLEREIEKELEK